MGMVMGFITLMLPTLALVTLAIYLPIYIYNRRKMGKRPIASHIAIFGLIGVVISIIYITLLIGGFSIKPGYYFLNLRPFVWVYETYQMGFVAMMRQLLLNVIMFVPLGFFLPTALKSMRKLWKTGLSLFGFIVAIETTQYFIGRSADIDDVIMNMLGGIIGYGIFALVQKLAELRARARQKE